MDSTNPTTSSTVHRCTASAVVFATGDRDSSNSLSRFGGVTADEGGGEGPERSSGDDDSFVFVFSEDDGGVVGDP